MYILLVDYRERAAFISPFSFFFSRSFLHAHSFSHLHHLRSLTIEYCKLGTVSRGVLHGLRDLRSLAIRSHNDVWPAMNLDLARDALAHDVPALERLDLSRNNVPSFRNQVFCELSTLQLLNVSHNRLADLNDLGLILLLSATNNSTTAESSIVAKATTTTSEEVAGSHCPTPLTTLDASHNQLTGLGRTSLAAMRHLRLLKLNNNKIVRLDGEALAPLEQLEQLDLSVNQLESLPESFLVTATVLKELNLSNNSLSILPSTLLASQRHLEVLLLSWNRLNFSTSDETLRLFDNLVRLVVLELSHNQIGRIRSKLFKDLYSLQVLKLDWNAIESVEAGSFASLSNLHTLDLSNNRLAFIERYDHNFSFFLSQSIPVILN